MTDPSTVARLASASTRKALLSLLGPPAPASADQSGNSNANGSFTTQAELFARQEKLDLQTAWKEALDDTAGVGVIPEQQQSKSGPSKSLTFGGGSAVDEALLRRRILGSGSNLAARSKSGAKNGSVLGKRGREAVTASRRDGFESEDEDEGRTGLGGSRTVKGGKSVGKAGKDQAREVETFASMQTLPERRQDQNRGFDLRQGETGDEEQADEDEDVDEVGREDESGGKPATRKPRSYLDELLEMKKTKQKKKKRKKNKVGGDTERAAAGQES